MTTMVDQDKYSNIGESLMASNVGRVRLRTLVGLRWIAIAGQTIAVFFVLWVLGFIIPLHLCLAAIGASAALNLFLTLRFPSTRLLKDTEATAYLAFDILQLAALLYLTGGIQNPFTILFIAPVTISAAMLGQLSFVFLVGLSFVSVSLLSIFHMPLPWGEDPNELSIPMIYKIGVWAAIMLGIGFTAVYIRRVAIENSRMADAFSATQMVLAREQRLSDLGALAAAAAHELGTPLSTIQLISKEVLIDIPKDSPYREDMEMISSQIARCRDILSRLSEEKEMGDAIYARQRLEVLIEEVVAPQLKPDKSIKTFFKGQMGEASPDIWRRPEIIYGLENLIENAMDFAKSTAAIETYWDDQMVEIQIVDDGPGFLPEIIERLGEPYVTSRPTERTNTRAAGRTSTTQAAEKRETIKQLTAEDGMGLGFFIAKTLLERTGGRLSFSNHTGRRLPNGDWLTGGAYVKVTWPRSVLEASQLAESVAK